jgi:hypothetical protein
MPTMNNGGHLFWGSAFGSSPRRGQAWAFGPLNGNLVRR